MRNPFRCFNSSPEVIRLTVMMYIRYPPSLRQVEDILFERGIDICHETIRFWWGRFGPMFANEIRKRRIQTRSYSHWRWLCVPKTSFGLSSWRNRLTSGQHGGTALVCTENLNPDVVVMKSAKDGMRPDASGPLNGSRDRCIF
ncbi:MAG: hypothetical protein PVJ46_09440, partial [Methyloceanibacter sp.]